MSKAKFCKCGGYGFFWSFEIRVWTGPTFARLACLECGNPTFVQRIIYWWFGYTSNDQVN